MKFNLPPVAAVVFFAVLLSGCVSTPPEKNEVLSEMNDPSAPVTREQFYQIMGTP